VEHGFFIGLTSEVHIAGAEGVRILRRSPNKWRGGAVPLDRGRRPRRPSFLAWWRSRTRESGADEGVRPTN